MGPLAERLRPDTFDNYIGQKHLVGPGAVLRKMVETGKIGSFILWGPPGVGKTTLAHIIAKRSGRTFFSLSAVHSSVKDVRDVIDKAEKSRFFQTGEPPILFIDEIHRFSKSQQDSLLGAVENGTVVLIGATTENPSFEVITPLLSRCQVYTLEALDEDELNQLLQMALRDPVMQSRKVELKETGALFQAAGGDARKLLNAIDLVVPTEPEGADVVVTDELVASKLQKNLLMYDKLGEMHYDIISAFIKSIRGSDPQAAVYWLARMVEGGEDPEFIARRLLISASEDIGLANPNAVLLANACFDAVKKLGWPESRIVLSETAVYLATSPKSNSAYLAIDAALAEVRQSGNLPVPLHLRNAPTRLMKQMNYGKGYRYAHDFPGHFVDQQYLPDALQDRVFWESQENEAEARLAHRMKNCWGNKRKS